VAFCVWRFSFSVYDYFSNAYWRAPKLEI